MVSLPRARRMEGIAPFRVMALLARAQALEASGHDIVHMEIGEPDFPTPEPVVEAARRALDAGHTRYTPACGLPALREAIAGHYAEAHGVAVDPERIVVTPGASGALQLVMGALVDPGARVLMTDPGYPCNRHFVRAFEGEAVAIPVDASTGYQPAAAELDSAWQGTVVAVLLGSPANPTGTVVPEAALEAIHERARARGAALIVDEIYHGLTYEAAPATAVGCGDGVIAVNSFSKYFGMTGWRLGWIVAPQALVPDLEKLAQNLFLAPSTPAQHAALAAFEPATREILEARREAFRERRDFLVPALRELGFEVPVTPQGAFYVYAGCGRWTDDSEAFGRELLEQAGVAATPGIDFGEHRAREHIRFAYTTSLERLEEGAERMRKWLGQ